MEPTAIESWTLPDYADPAGFEEHEVTLGPEYRAVRGTLTLPRGDGPWPGVVLLSGGGPFDRDETVGPNKPLKDLAWGLASRGAATLRFDKLTSMQPDLTSRPDFTMTDEYVPHALAAIELLGQQPTVDPQRIYVLGHSMGGKVAPRVAAASDSVAGLVILAGDTQPMHHAAVRVARHLAAADPSLDAWLAALTTQARTVDSPDLSPTTPPADLPFGFSGSYWLDLRQYDPAATAASLDLPMLILQGGRDYQVTVEHDLAGWRTALAGRTNVTTEVYPADDHFFFPGTGPSTPADYAAAQHVDPAVIDDVAGWLN